MRVLTNDVFAGAFLIARGARVVELLVDRTGTRETGTFVLEGPTALEDHEAYSRGEAVANVKMIREGVTHLRGRLARALRHAA